MSSAPSWIRSPRRHHNLEDSGQAKRHTASGELATDNEAHIHQGAGCKSGGGALKAVELTTGGLLHVVETRLEKERFFLNLQQKSAEGIVVQQIGRRPER